MADLRTWKPKSKSNGDIRTWRPSQDLESTDQADEEVPLNNESMIADISHSLSGLPFAAINALTSLPGQVYEAGKFALQHPIKAAGNLAAGVGEGAIGAFNLPGNLTRYAASRGLYPKSLAKYAPHIGDLGIEKRLGLGNEEGESFLRGIGSFTPYGKIGGLSEKLGSRLLANAAYAGGQEQDPLVGALLPELLRGGIKKVEQGINAVKPHNLFKTRLDKKDLVRAYQQAKGTETDIGNLAQNPRFKRMFENTIPKAYGEARNRMMDTGEKVRAKGEEVMQSLLGEESAENVPSRISEILGEQYKKHQDFKNSFYNAVDDLAQKDKLQLDLSNFANKASHYVEAIKDTNLLKHEPESRAILNKLLKFENPVETTTKTGAIVDEYGKPLLDETTHKYPTLKEANILKGKLGDYAKYFRQSSDSAQRNMGRIFSQLSGALKRDINESIDKSGNETLQKGYRAAEENYKKNFSPFLDKDVYRFISGHADPETIVSKFLSTGKGKDLAGKLSKIQDRLPGYAQNLMSYGYLSRALENDGTFNPGKFATAVKQLGKNQVKTLFPDKKIRKQVMDYKGLAEMNKESLETLFNPKTGQRNEFNLLPAAVGSVVGAITGGVPGTIPGILLAHALSSKGAKAAFNKLTNEELRRNIIKGMLHGKDKNLAKTKKYVPALGAIANQAPLQLEMTHPSNYD